MAEPAPPGAPADAPDDISLTRQVQALLRDLPGLFSDRVELLALEVQRAARALAQVVVLVVAIAVLGVTAWLVLWAGAIRLLMAAGLSLEGALAVALLVNSLAIVLAVRRVRHLLPQLALPATRRHLLPARAPDDPEDPGNRDEPSHDSPAHAVDPAAAPR